MGEAFGIYSFGNDNQIIDYIVCSENPARLFGLYPTKGVLQVGSDADLVIVDPEKEATVDRAYHRASTTVGRSTECPKRPSSGAGS
jgi:dihydroorotase-like cyclic amidohydrolase